MKAIKRSFLPFDGKCKRKFATLKYKCGKADKTKRKEIIMKKIIQIFLISMICVSLVACGENSSDTKTNEVTTENTQNEEMEEARENKEDVSEEYYEDEEEPYSIIGLFGGDENYAEVQYRESGVSILFFGNNEFSDGYAFLENSKSMYGEAEFFKDGKGSGDSETLYIANSGQEVYFSFSEENYREEGIIYYISDIEAISESFIGAKGETQHWIATDVKIYSSDLGAEQVPESTYVNMTTTNPGDGSMLINMQGNGEWLFDNKDGFVDTSSYPYRGAYSGGEITVIPENDIVVVAIRYMDTGVYDYRTVVVYFEKSDGEITANNAVEIGENSQPIIFVDSEMERLLAEFLALPVGEIYPEHMQAINSIAIFGEVLYEYSTDGDNFSYNINGWNQYSTGGITTLDDLKYCTNLKELYIGLNQVSDISGISELNQLKVVNLTSNQISDVSSLANIKTLEKLVLDHNNISDISSLTGLENLTLLDLGSNNNNTFNDMESISKFTNLESLTLYNNMCSDISLLSNLTKLEFLSLSTNDITDITSLENLTNLKRLYLGQNYNLSDVSVLNNLENLYYVSLKKTAVTDTSQLPNLVGKADIEIGDD